MHLQLFSTFVMGIFLLFSWWVELVRSSQRMEKAKVNIRRCLIYLCPIGWWKVKREQRKETDVKKKTLTHIGLPKRITTISIQFKFQSCTLSSNRKCLVFTDPKANLKARNRSMQWRNLSKRLGTSFSLISLSFQGFLMNERNFITQIYKLL